ncbi:MAG: response regulator transcription factor [Elusimicrobia bacterium]|nr:response regulator transcription factor [Elusimicrobiota bacterium]
MAKILVVDDEASIRELLKEILTSQGHTVEMGVDGRDAVQLTRKNSYQLLILDRNMPHMTGIEALQLIRMDAKLKGMKVMMFTSASVIREVDEAFQAGADDYLLKPVNIKNVVDKVQAILK